MRNLRGETSAFHGADLGADLVVVRENAEDVYSGIEHQIAPGVVAAVKVITTRGSRRIARFARFAFDHAQRTGRTHVTAIHKANISVRRCHMRPLVAPLNGRPML